jgi:glycerophosphoryl diester phosphodiesterase
MSRPLVIAHRGASGHEVENTLAAFRAAAALGADAVELDIHETADGAFLVHHGNMVGHHHISHCSLREIREHLLPNGEPAPILEEALAVILPGMSACVETKKLSAENDERFLAVLDGSASPQRVAVHAFDHRIIQRLGAARPHLRRGVISASYPVDPVRCMADSDAQVLWEEWPFVDEALVTAVHASGKLLYAWTVNDTDRMAQLARLGVDGLCTDRPEVARQVIDDVPR